MSTLGMLNEVSLQKAAQTDLMIAHDVMAERR